jgi:hypothetical protein
MAHWWARFQLKQVQLELCCRNWCTHKASHHFCSKGAPVYFSTNIDPFRLAFLTEIDKPTDDGCGVFQVERSYSVLNTVLLLC